MAFELGGGGLGRGSALELRSSGMTFARWGIPTLLWVTLVLGWAVLLVPAGPFRWLTIAVAIFCWGFTLAFFLYFLFHLTNL